MKAYYINDDEIWAANSLEEAIADYEQTAGEKLENPEDVREATDAELDTQIKEYDDNEEPTGDTISMRQLLREKYFVGMLATRLG
jgi:hypothetical protein